MVEMEGTKHGSKLCVCVYWGGGMYVRGSVYIEVYNLFSICNLLYLVDLLHKLWIPGKSRNPQPRLLNIKEGSKVFTEYFDEVQEQLETLATMDDLLSGRCNRTLYMLRTELKMLITYRHVKQI